ncbi:DUF4102 domain-containing protein [Bartonella sp. ML70XJBT.G]|nr:DUF4102 domain-containing protein [Bartonella sp. ML70XJBT.G]
MHLYAHKDGGVTWIYHYTISEFCHEMGIGWVEEHSLKKAGNEQHNGVL